MDLANAQKDLATMSLIPLLFFGVVQVMLPITLQESEQCLVGASGGVQRYLLLNKPLLEVDQKLLSIHVLCCCAHRIPLRRRQRG